jgi:signal transduction histidine kinase
MILVNSGFDNDNSKFKVRPLITSSVTRDDITLVADDKLLAQVFINIVKNSIEAFGKYKEDDFISMSADRNPDGRVVLTIKDNGPGMDADTLEKIFVPFFTTKESGTGIGLSLSRQIIRLHNGNIICNSTPGEGTTVTILF